MTRLRPAPVRRAPGRGLFRALSVDMVSADMGPAFSARPTLWQMPLSIATGAAWPGARADRDGKTLGCAALDTIGCLTGAVRCPCPQLRPTIAAHNCGRTSHTTEACPRPPRCWPPSPVPARPRHEARTEVGILTCWVRGSHLVTSTRFPRCRLQRQGRDEILSRLDCQIRHRRWQRSQDRPSPLPCWHRPPIRHRARSAVTTAVSVPKQRRAMG